VIPRQRFGTGFVSINVVAGARIDARTRSAFVVRQAAPQIRGYAVPRTAVPIYAAGTRARAARSDGRTAGVETYRGSVRSMDETAAFRSRRPGATTRVGPGYPAPARTPREGGAAGAARSADTAGIPVYRGSAIPRERSAGSPVSTPPARLEVPGYRRAPAPAGPNAAPDRATRPAPRTFSVPDRTAVPRRSGGASPYPAPYQAAPAGPAAPGRSVRPAPARPAGDLYQATPRTYGRERPAPAPPPSPGYGGENRPFATPRAAQPFRSAGPPERMTEPPQRMAPPPQRMAAPPRESREPGAGPAPRTASPPAQPAGRPEGRAVARPRNR
jgi:hypothetical protein